MIESPPPSRLPVRMRARVSLPGIAALISSLWLGATQASSYLPAPLTLREQLNGADLVGEFDVVSATTVILEDGFPVTHVTLRTLTEVRGGAPAGTLILPGGVVGGRFVRGLPDGFQVIAGETLFLMVENAVDLEGYYNIAYGPHVGVFRRVERGGRTLMVDPQGRVVSTLTCDGVAVRARPLEEAPAGATLDEEGRVTSSGGSVGLIFVEDPDAAGIRWDDAVAALATCGGSR